MRVLVTGATGFVGRHLTRRLVAQGHHVRAFVRRESRTAAKAGAEMAPGDITEPEAVTAALEGVEAVFHLAAMRDKWAVPEAAYQAVNVEGTRNVLDAAIEAGVSRFVYCSSVGVARYPGRTDADETLPYSKPVSQLAYHLTKAEAERAVLAAAQAGYLPALVVRPVITYGPQDRRGMVTRLAMLLARGTRLLVGNGQNHVDLVYIDDLVDGMCLALERGAAGRVYILSGTRPIELSTLVSQICELLARKPPRLHIPVPVARVAGWCMERLYSTGTWLGVDLNGTEPFVTCDKVATLTIDRGFSHKRASEELGYRPRVDYSEGLQRTIVWCRRAGVLG